MNLSDVIKSIEQEASRSIKQNEGDYFNADGLLMCGKCHTPKQVKVELFGGFITPMCLCKCETEKRDLEESERQRRQFLQKVKELRKMGFPHSEMENWTFEHDDGKNERLSTLARNYVEHFPEMKQKGKGLLLYGAVGTGKTFMSACIANALIDRGYPCLVTNFARLTNTIGGMYEGKQEYLDSLNRFALLVIDDLASERDTEYMSEIVQNIIDARYRSGKPIIITTNLTGDELKRPGEVRKQRIYSRLFEMCFPFYVEGEDRRQKNLKANFEEMKNILGV